MPKDHLVADIPVKALIEKNGHILIVFDGKMWELPGGRLCVSEQPSEALSREMQEELGIEVTAKRICDAFPFTSWNGTKHFAVVFHCTLKDPLRPLCVDVNEIKEIRWVSAKDDLTSLAFAGNYRKTLENFFKKRPIPFNKNRIYEWLICSQSFLQCALITARTLKLKLETFQYGAQEGESKQWCLKTIYGDYAQDCSYLIFPILYNFKHGIELYLKAIIGMDAGGLNKEHDLINLHKAANIESEDCKNTIGKYARCNFLLPKNQIYDSSNEYERYAVQGTPYDNLEFYGSNDGRSEALPKITQEKVDELIKDIGDLTKIIREESLKRLREIQ